MRGKGECFGRGRGGMRGLAGRLSAMPGLRLGCRRE